jgi:aspartyl-tRNA(Asn)/glutamyl-tRNA(Gln) amidotransferase subunit A
MKIADKNTSAVSLVRAALEKAKQYEKYNIFVSLNEENALRRAKEIDQKIAAGETVGRLAGVPYAAKDNFLSKEGNTTASSQILAPFKSPITATAIKKLEAEGAIMIGRANMDAFAHGSSTENSFFGPTHNSVDFERVAGGSSGGSAVAVALGIVPFATGTDTGGSIRQPASFNGVYGLKPTYGTISRYGVVAMASSTDCVGFLAKTPEDIDLLMQITSGQDPYDMTTLPDFYNASTKEAKDPIKPAKIGIIKDFRSDALDQDIQKALDDKVAQLKQRGHEVIELDMPTLKYALAAYYIIVPAEISSNLSRHDGIRYGYRTDDFHTLNDVYSKSRNEGFMPENKRRIMIGNFVLSSGFYDAYYLKAQKARTLVIKEYEEAFKKVDFLLTPVSPNPAFKLGEKVNDPVAMYLEDVMSVPINLAGLPGLALPAGETATGLPLGLQLIGPRRSDARLLRFAKELA